MSSGADASDLDAALARLSGPDLVAHLRATCRRADYDAAARVLADRDRRLAALAKDLPDLKALVQQLEERYLALKAKESRGPCSRCCSAGAIAAAAPRADRRAREPGPIIDLSSSDDDEELEEGEFRSHGVAGVSCQRKEESASKGDQGRRAAGVSCERKESASKGEVRSPAGVSCKRKEPASACSPDGEDDTIPLSQLFIKKRRTIAQPGANGEPKKGHGDVQVNSAGLLGVDRPAISPVNRGIPQAVSAEHMVGSTGDPKVAVLVQGAGNGQSGKNVGLSRAMPNPPPSGSTAGNSSLKNVSKPNGSEGQARIGGKQGPLACPKNDAPVQVRTPSVTDTVRRIVGSARVGAETPMKHTDPSPDRRGNGEPKKGHGDVLANSAGLLGADRPAISPVNRGIPQAVSAEHMVGDPKVAVLVQGAGNGQSEKNAGLSRAMPSPPPSDSTAGNSSRKNGSKPSGSEGQARMQGAGNGHLGMNGGLSRTMPSPVSVVLKDTREQGKPDGQVLHTKVLPRTDVIRGQECKLSPCQSPVDIHGGRPTTTYKTVSPTLQHKNQLVLHSEQMSVESSLPSAITRGWKSSSDVFKSCLVGDKELLMQAVCALHRQKKFTTHPIPGGLTKYDAHRAAALAEFLLDGNLQGPLKRTAKDLEEHDSTGHDFVERVVLQCSEQLFSIYRSKDDKYFR